MAVRLRTIDWFVLSGFVVGFHLMGTTLVRYFYNYHIPHFDSVGGLITTLEILHTYRIYGYFEGVAEAWSLAPLSITQNLFPALLAPFIDPSPQGAQLYNTFAFALAALSVVVLLRRFGASLPALCLGIMIILAGDALYWWDLGAFDYRRDFGMYGFLTCSLLAGASVFVGELSRRGEIWGGVLFGVVFGLTSISRDSASLLMVGIVAAPLACLVLYAGWRDGWLPQLRKIGFALVGFAPFFLVFLLRVEAILARVTNPLIMFGIDGNNSNSFVGNARRVPDVVFGLFEFRFNDAPWISVSLLACLFAGIGFLALKAWHSRSAVESAAEANDEAPAQTERVRLIVFLMGCAVWIPLFVHVFLSMWLKWAWDQPPIVAMAPYLPVLIGLTTLCLAGMVYAIEQYKTSVGRVLCLALAALIVVSMPARALTRLIDYPPGTLTLHHYLASLRGREGGAAVVAPLVDRSDLMRLPAVRMLAMQKGLQPPESLRVRVNVDLTVDFQVAVPADEELRSAILGAMDTAIRCEADYIVLDTDIPHYGQADRNLLLYNRGEQMMGALFKDLRRKVVRRFASTSVVLIDNTQRAACSDLEGDAADGE